MQPWNKNKAVGQKKPLSPEKVRLLKDLLKSRSRLKELVLFSMAIDTMLRAGDLLNLKVSDILNNNNEIRDEISIKQQKTKESHLVQLSETTKICLLQYLQESKKLNIDFLFSGSNTNKPLTVRWYRELVKEWVKLLGLDARDYSTHSLRRTRASLIYSATGNIEAVRQLLGQRSVSSTSSYLNLNKQEALRIAKNFLI